MPKKIQHDTRRLIRAEELRHQFLIMLEAALEKFNGDPLRKTIDDLHRAHEEKLKETV